MFGSKTKSDILKYLIFRRQGVSMRALEAEIGWTFPAIKKQVDSSLHLERIFFPFDFSKLKAILKYLCIFLFNMSELI